MKRRLRLLVARALAIVFAPVIAAAAMLARVGRTMHRRSRPRVAWGPVQNIGNLYMSKALRGRGYDSVTIVYEGDRLVEADRFDRVFRPVPGRNVVSDHVNAYLCFVYVVFRFDVAVFWFNGGFLLDTPWQLPEMCLLRLAGLKTIIMPYGSDVAVPAFLGPGKAASLANDPGLASRTGSIVRRVDYYCRYCDFVIRNVTPGYVPRCDAFVFNILAIDIAAEAEPDADDRFDGGSELVVLHASNHRLLKGTNELIAAVDALRTEGVAIRLELIERQPNTAVRAALSRCDIVADQFVFGYGMFAVEGFAAGKPVLTRLGWMLPEVIAGSCLAACPALDTDVTTIKDRLRTLAGDPDLRRRLGRASRAYALAHHSYAAVGEIFAAIVEHVWNGAPLPQRLRPVATDAPFGLHYPVDGAEGRAPRKVAEGALT